MTRLFLARHGETDWNVHGKLQGHTDVPLNDQGRAQALLLAKRLVGERVTSVTTSDLSRAAETGAVIARHLAVDVPAVDAGLRERAFGVFEGLTRDECAERHPEAWRAWIEQTSPPEGAEPVQAAIERMGAALARIAARSPGSHVLVVSHGGLMRLWLQSVLGTTLPLIPNGAVFVLDHEGDVFRVSKWES